MNLLAIDPGVHHCGVALFEGGQLIDARLVIVDPDDTYYLCHPWTVMANAVMRALDNRPAHEVVIERPQIYKKRNRGDKANADPNDLIDLAGVGGAIAGRLWWGTALTTVLPHDWKGSTAKEVVIDGEKHYPMIERVKGWLTEGERTCVTLPKVKKRHHDVWDAVGIGVHFLRLKGLRK